MTAPFPAGLSSITDTGGRPGIELSGPGGRVRMTLLGAHVQSWIHPEHGEVLFMSTEASYGEGTASRGGVPLVFPWFGAHTEREDAPAHGFARILPWEVAGYGDGPSVTLRLQESDRTRTLWPHAFLAELNVSVADALRITLTVSNTGDHDLHFEEALHTYFAIGDVQGASVHGLEGVPFVESASAPQIAPVDPDQPIVFLAETDRIYQGVPDDIELRSGELARTIQLTTRGARSAIVWNPWIAKAAAMGQLRDDEWLRFVCVESANCRENRVRLKPGATHSLELLIRARPQG